MSDDDPIPSLAEALAEFRRERTLQDEFETTDDIVRRMHERVSRERNHFRAAIVEMASDQMPDAEVRRRLLHLAEGIEVRKAAYAKWREEYRAQFASTDSILAGQKVPAVNQ